MNRIKKYFTPLIAGAIALSLSSCGSFSVNRDSDSSNLTTPETANTPLTSQLDSNSPTPTPSPDRTPPVAQPQNQAPTPTQPSKAADAEASSTAKSAKTVSLTIYQADTQCQALVPETVAVAAESLADAAVGKVLEKAESGDFDLAGYRVNINAKSGVATVDLRLAPDSQRQFASLSACEQFALFGSLRKTLTDNSQLNVKDVRFTEQGQEIVL